MILCPTVGLSQRTWSVLDTNRAVWTLVKETVGVSRSPQEKRIILLAGLAKECELCCFSTPLLEVFPLVLWFSTLTKTTFHLSWFCLIFSFPMIIHSRTLELGLITLHQQMLPVTSALTKNLFSNYLTATFNFTGPLMCQGEGDRWFLTGVASFGHTGCGVPNKYGVYTRVVNHLRWISKVTGMNIPQPRQQDIPLTTVGQQQYAWDR